MIPGIKKDYQFSIRSVVESDYFTDLNDCRNKAMEYALSHKEIGCIFIHERIQVVDTETDKIILYDNGIIDLIYMNLNNEIEYNIQKSDQDYYIFILKENKDE